MSVFDEKNPQANPEHQFDLLVDGELSESDRRDLLVRLEHEPDGWRRCALAFLEAQCWKAEAHDLRAELGQLAAPAAEALPSVQPLSQAAPDVSQFRQTGKWRTWRQYAATTLSVAAGIMIAVAIGMGISGSGIVGTHPQTSSLKTVKDEFPLPNHEGPNQNAANQGTAAAGPANNWEMVTLAADSSDGKTQTYSVPAQHRETLDQNLLEQMPGALPPQVEQALEQSGHRIVHKREIVPVQMGDGSRLVVPVDNVEIHYVGRQSF